MNENKFDKCPNCGGDPQFGLRCHPKFAVCYEGSTSEGPDMLMAYSHTLESNETLAAPIGSNVLYKQKWDHEQLKWIEYH